MVSLALSLPSMIFQMTSCPGALTVELPMASQTGPWTALSPPATVLPCPRQDLWAGDRDRVR